MSDKPPFEIVETSLGALSIRDNNTGEIMHNPVGPWREANELYVNQSGLRHRLAAASNESLVLFDVGLGAGFNALAAVVEYETSLKMHAPHPVRPLHIVSFEQDLRLFEFSKNNVKKFPEILEFAPLMAKVLGKGDITTENQLRWTIRAGPFARTIKKEEFFPEVTFFDPYSPKVNGDMWTLETFKSLYDLAIQNPLSSCLMTYSVATGIRTGLLLAGFFVGSGVSSGFKHETTFAATRLEDVPVPLDLMWLERWRRSANALPPQCSLTPSEAEKLLLGHPQFRPPPEL